MHSTFSKIHFFATKAPAKINRHLKKKQIFFLDSCFSCGVAGRVLVSAYRWRQSTPLKGHQCIARPCLAFRCSIPCSRVLQQWSWHLSCCQHTWLLFITLCFSAQLLTIYCHPKSIFKRIKIKVLQYTLKFQWIVEHTSEEDFDPDLVRDIKTLSSLIMTRWTSFIELRSFFLDTSYVAKTHSYIRKEKKTKQKKTNPSLNH